MNRNHFSRVSFAMAAGAFLASAAAFAGNTVTGTDANVAGGDNNTAIGNYSAVTGGKSNVAGGDYAVVGGEYNNASGINSFIGGGESSSASAYGSTVGAGIGNEAQGAESTVSGGSANFAVGFSSTISGGTHNYAIGLGSTSPGGTQNVAGGDYSFAGGNNANVRPASVVGGSNTTGDQGTFIWSDAITVSTTYPPPCLDLSPPPCIDISVPQFTSNGPNQFLVRANGGFGLNARPVNANIAMTLTSTQTNTGYVNLFMHQSTSPDGILLSSGDATTTGNDQNNASFYVDQYNGAAQNRLLSLTATGLTSTVQAYKPGGGSWAASSDGRLKKNVQSLGNALDRLLALRGVTFEYSHPDASMHPAGTFTGFIAQEVQQTFPSWVGHDAQGYLTVGPQGFEALTVEALRQMKNEGDARIAKLESDNAQLREQIAQQLETQKRAMVELQKQVAVLTKGLDGKSALAEVSTTEKVGY